MIGYKIAGLSGGIGNGAGYNSASIDNSVIISLFYTVLKQNLLLNALLKGMQAGVAAVIANVISMTRSLCKDKNILSIVILSRLYCCIYLKNQCSDYYFIKRCFRSDNSFCQKRNKRGSNITYLKLFLSFFQIGLFAIGGGYAAMPLIQNQVVEINGWLTMDEFIDLVTIAEMTPGPIAINAATFVGTRAGGLLELSYQLLAVYHHH